MDFVAGCYQAAARGIDPYNRDKGVVMEFSETNAFTPNVKPSDFMLPHPLRVQKHMGDSAAAIKDVLGPDWPGLLELFQDPNFLLANVMYAADKKNLHLVNMVVSSMLDAPGTTEIGGSMPLLAALRHLNSPYRLFRLTDDLVHLLSLTDVERDVPLSFLKMPYPRIYLEFGQKRDVPLKIHNEVSGMHVCEGCYLEYGVDEQRGPGLYVLITGSPIGKTDVMDDATFGVFLPMDDLDKPLSQALHESFVNAEAQSTKIGLKNISNQNSDSLSIFQLIAKALLYIGLPEARKAENLVRTQLLAQLKGMKSPAKVAKLRRRLQLANDEIIISAPVGWEGTSSASSSLRGMSMHWRRGHYRNQRHGKELALVRLIFIAPVLVNGDASMAPDKVYIVK